MKAVLILLSLLCTLHLFGHDDNGVNHYYLYTLSFSEPTFLSEDDATFSYVQLDRVLISIKGKSHIRTGKIETVWKIPNADFGTFSYFPEARAVGVRFSSLVDTQKSLFMDKTCILECGSPQKPVIFSPEKVEDIFTFYNIIKDTSGFYLYTKIIAPNIKYIKFDILKDKIEYINAEEHSKNAVAVGCKLSTSGRFASEEDSSIDYQLSDTIAFDTQLYRGHYHTIVDNHKRLAAIAGDSSGIYTLLVYDKIANEWWYRTRPNCDGFSAVDFNDKLVFIYSHGHNRYYTGSIDIFDFYKRLYISTYFGDYNRIVGWEDDIVIAAQPGLLTLFNYEYDAEGLENKKIIGKIPYALGMNTFFSWLNPVKIKKKINIDSKGGMTIKSFPVEQ